MSELFSAYQLGRLALPNRVVMAPMTRAREPGPAFVPTALTAEYYAQRSSAGLIITGGIAISEQARGYCCTPGLYSAEQEQAWKRLTEAVHARGGRIFAQLWHCGRISHESVRADGSPPVGASAIAARSNTLGCEPGSGCTLVVPCSTPRVLDTAEVRRIPLQFAAAAGRAVAAGFDGVEIHGADGYLLDQFRCPFINHRSDEYGGSRQNRARLLLECASAAAAIVGPDRVGVRLSPLGIANDMRLDPAPNTTYPHLAKELDSRGIAYLHLNDQSLSWVRNRSDPLLRRLRRAFPRTLILCGGFDGHQAQAMLGAGLADLIAFGRPFVSNPDLVERLRDGLPLAPYDPRTFYQDGASGYVDYPPARHAQGAVRA
jgi:N-ethylmaleimide reductase